ncbi:MAG: asparagine synthase (glutamine-hydrolyzing) [Candidatus Moranbacteria bacterium]|nr:asparagine synthase (glutamine-hydrolyzing) [Candidatus Moranbacteria bacterium]
MCGITGVYSLDTKKPILKQEIDLLTDAVAHRGPDGRGVWMSQDSHVALGHRRLSILDLSENGKQPMAHSNGRYQITFNGEIYNFLEIRDELIKRGYIFNSDSDTEVVLASYQEWGKDMLERFNGMWAFAIYDAESKELFLSRDRFGIKPLYYFRDDERFLFSSEVQALHKILGSDHSLDERVIKDIASGSFVNHGTEKTYLKDVKNLPGGFNLFLKDGEVEVEEWYSLKKVDVPKKFEDQALELKKLLTDACNIRLRSDVSIGTCLSGGLDSGSITAVIENSGSENKERFSHYTHRGFCAAFPNTPIDESKSAKILAEKLNSKLDVVDILPPDKTDLEEAMRQCDGPMHALAFFPIWSLYRYIKKQGITVTLDGQGPDEMLGGYRPLFDALSAAIELKKPKWFWDAFRTYSEQGETSQFSSKWYARKILLVVVFRKILEPIGKFLSIFGFSLLRDNLSKLNSEYSNFLIPVRKSVGFNNSFDRGLFRQFFQSPLPGILNQYDRCSMAHGVECRMPFMDYRIVEYIFSLPIESKVGGGYTKRVLREAMKGIVPDETRLDKIKIGFNAPIVDWFCGSLKDFMFEQMSKPKFINSKYFDGAKIKNDFDKFLGSSNPKWDAAWKFWPPVHLIWWMDYNNVNEN